MEKKQINIFAQVVGAIARAKQKIRTANIKTEMTGAERAEFIRAKQRFRISPADWFNHKSRTFKKNRRRGL